MGKVVVGAISISITNTAECQASLAVSTLDMLT